MSLSPYDCRFSLDNDPSHESDPTIREKYLSSLAELRRDYPDAAPYLGRRNPYTGELIRTDTDFDAYRRQRALSLVYASRYLSELDAHEAQLAHKDTMLAAREKELTELNASCKKQKKAAHTWRGLSVLMIIVVCLTIFVGLPHARDTAFKDGHSDGYRAGLHEGYNDGYQKGSDKGYNSGYAEGYGIGQSSGYSAGYKAGSSDSSSSSLLRSLPTIAAAEDTVYVSRNGVIHSRSNCSGMIHYTEMSYADAVAAGYRLCSKCY